MTETKKLTLDLGKTRVDSLCESAEPESEQPKKYYPLVYLSDIPGLEAGCPEEFWIKCRKVSLTTKEHTNRDEETEVSTSVEAECLEMVCEVPVKRQKSWMESFDDIQIV